MFDLEATRDKENDEYKGKRFLMFDLEATLNKENNE